MLELSFMRQHKENSQYLISNERMIFSGQTSFVWSPTHLSLQANVEVGGLTVFGLETSLDELTSGEMDFFFKNWAKDLYECEVSLSNKRLKTNFIFTLFLIPFNREIKSKFNLKFNVL